MKYAFDNANLIDGTQDMRVQPGLCVLTDGETITDDARVCNLDATGEQLYYTVELSAAKPGADPTIYWVKVSTADGSILDVTATQ